MGGLTISNHSGIGELQDHMPIQGHHLQFQEINPELEIRNFITLRMLEVHRRLRRSSICNNPFLTNKILNL